MSADKIEKIGFYPGTFDPMTNGHLDIVERAARMFDKVIIAIGINPSKKGYFSLEERQDMVEKICEPIGNVLVCSFSGLAVDYASKNGVTAIVRGLRTEADYVYEMQMAMMNRTLNNKIETILIPTRQDLSHVSSTLVREVASLGGNVSNLVPPIVYQALTEKGRDS